MTEIYKSARQDYVYMLRNYFELMQNATPYAYKHYKSQLFKVYKKLDYINTKIARGLQ